MNRKNDNFENGYFWELYKDLERQFATFLEYVPYLKGNEAVYSFKLLNIILSIGGYVDSAFKEMARYSEFAKNKHCRDILKLLKESEENIKKGKAPKTVSIDISLKAFEKEYGLSKRIVKFKRLPEREDLNPFKPNNPRTKAPEWWEIYNGLKHDVGVNVENANLNITKNALAGAFLLNVVHIPSAQRLYAFHILKTGPQEYEGSTRVYVKPLKYMVENDLKTKRPFEGSVSTPIFLYDYNQ